MLMQKLMKNLLAYLNEDKKSLEIWRDIKHEPSIFREQLNIAFVPSINKDWRLILRPSPMPIIKQIPLLKRLITLGLVVKVIYVLREVFDLIANFHSFLL